MRNSHRYGNFCVLGAPLVGALATALFLFIRAFLDAGLRGDIVFAFVVWFIDRLVIGYVLALPFLLLARRLGLRQFVGFALISLLAAVPYEWYTSDPMNAWHPSEAELDHGFYLASFLISIGLASITGICFSLGTSLTRRAQKSVGRLPSTPAA